MLELDTFSANLHHVSDYQYKEKHFSLVSMLMEVPGGHQWRRDKLPEDDNTVS
jgi:hypothetical protein